MGALKNCSESLSAQEFVAIHRHYLARPRRCLLGPVQFYLGLGQFAG